MPAFPAQDDGCNDSCSDRSLFSCLRCRQALTSTRLETPEWEWSVSLTQWRVEWLGDDPQPHGRSAPRLPPVPSGFPSVGKSTLLNKLTGTFSEVSTDTAAATRTKRSSPAQPPPPPLQVASYEFTTLTCIPGIIRYRGASHVPLHMPPPCILSPLRPRPSPFLSNPFPSVNRAGRPVALMSAQPQIRDSSLPSLPSRCPPSGAKIQLLDLPGIIEGAKDGKGRGRQVISTARTCNLIIIVLDCLKPITHKRLIEHELEVLACLPISSPCPPQHRAVHCSSSHCLCPEDVR